MSKKVLIGIGIVGVLIVIAVAAYVLRPPAEASAPIEAISVEVEQSAAEEPETVVEEAAPVEEPTEIPVAEDETEKWADLQERIENAEQMIEWVNSQSYLESLHGTMGADWVHRES